MKGALLGNFLSFHNIFCLEHPRNNNDYINYSSVKLKKKNKKKNVKDTFKNIIM